MGTAGEMMLTPFGSMIVGLLAGIISVLGYKYLSVRTIQQFMFYSEVKEGLDSQILTYLI